MFNFHGAGNINQFAVYAQDAITLGHFLFNVGFRADHYVGLTTTTAPNRAWASPTTSRDGTVLRVAYSRTFETPFNENLLLSSATGAGGLRRTFSAAYPHPFSRPPQPVQHRLPTGHRQIPDGRRRLFLEVHTRRF